MKYTIPGHQTLEINTILLDLNGTLAAGGVLVDGVKPRIEALRQKGFSIVLLTGNTRNDADALAANLNIDWQLAKTAEDKYEAANNYGLKTCASVGNGLIDLEVSKAVALSIVVLQAEGIHTQTLMAADIVIPTINDALDLFIDVNRLVATLRC